MKRKGIAIINIALMAVILAFAVMYSGYESRAAYLQRVESFERTTITMERVTENYLEGEQGICDVCSANGEVIYLIRKAIEEFEKEHGKIEKQ